MQQIWKLLTLINHPIRNGILAAASAVMLVSCGGGGGGVPPWIGTKQLGVAGLSDVSVSETNRGT